MERPGDRGLAGLLEQAARRFPQRTAVVEPGGTAVTYAELRDLSREIRRRLRSAGVGPGDRVGLLQTKSIAAVGSLLGVLQAGAAYVPLDAGAPALRNARILLDCSVRAVIAHERLAPDLVAALKEFAPAPAFLPAGTADGVMIPLSIFSGERTPATRGAGGGASPAFILYTSGSTGNPKGVVHTHRGALSFVGWCSRKFAYSREDRFASHAPLHFDLSVHDLFVSLRQGATLVLIGEELGKNPALLAQVIADERISVWYSTPAVLGLLAGYGTLDRLAFPNLRRVLFAGEVFPMAQLRRLRALWPAPAYFNLFGPTETNVCTYYPLPGREETERMESLPIGRTCEHLRSRVVDEGGAALADGREGELVVSGPAVMKEYFGQRRMTVRAFLRDTGGQRWYRTGDRVIRRQDGIHLFLGRRDRMVKKRGYRIELQEIESCLCAHPQAREAAAVAVADAGGSIRIQAFVACSGATAPTVIAFKEFCAQRLPRYMVPDRFFFPSRLPRTAGDKIDYHTLEEID
jgi:amino acid adenylation domain-containing protein